jgi:hypothetical protein
MKLLLDVVVKLFTVAVKFHLDHVKLLTAEMKLPLDDAQLPAD